MSASTARIHRIGDLMPGISSALNPRRPVADVFAQVLSAVLSPPPVLVVLISIVAWKASPSAEEALKWAVLAITFTSLVPTLIIVRRVRSGLLSDPYMARREQRPATLLLGLGSVIGGFALLVLSGAPRDVIALSAAMTAGLALATAVSVFWKISFHTAVTAAAVVILTHVFGPTSWLLAPAVAAVGWARVYLRAHTPAQVIAGAALGSAIVAVT
jgi:membrane-associated phospholipid phosphatase